ncbi:MAG: type II secretion system protein [Verrucomicrobia bacterium]|nr:type II secretion system protein [Verrucomicrobiota bacterium]
MNTVAHLRHTKRDAFTLIELLVVIAIIQRPFALPSFRLHPRTSKHDRRRSFWRGATGRLGVGQFPGHGACGRYESLLCRRPRRALEVD